ncbi:MAG: hypothetical protein KG003_07105 [Bacteroidetes bacterium]|nr:hypothetical protein [Bacteroidota bacterium]
MKRILSALIFITSITGLWAQEDSSEILMPEFRYKDLKSFTYRLISQEYLSNENGYILGAIVDTSYLQFTRMESANTFRMLRSKKDRSYVPITSTDTTKKMPLEIEFFPSGKVKELRNWKLFRDIFMSSASAQARNGLISNSDFNDLKEKLNQEGNVRRLVMEDINYLFLQYGDTFNTAIEYLRLKAIRSPFSGFDYYFQGNLKIEKLAGSKYSYVFQAKNEAGPKEKPLLMEEAQAYLKKTVPAGEPVSEIKRVGLNSEQNFTYNNYQKRMMSAIFSDVVVLDMSSRGNIRNYDFWDSFPR